MSVVEAAIERVKQLDEAHARKLLAWLQSLEGATASPRQPLGAMAMLLPAASVPASHDR